MTEFGNYLIPCVIGLIWFWPRTQGPLIRYLFRRGKGGGKVYLRYYPGPGRADYSGEYAEGQRRFGYVYRVHRAAGGKIGLPPQVVPLMLLRPVSGSGSLALVDQIFSSSGVDSFAGRVAAVMMGSTETTFYAIAVYFGSVNIRKPGIPSPAL